MESERMKIAPDPVKKERMRREAIARRKSLPDKDLKSLAIWHLLSGCREYRSAETILLYLDVGSEVRTHCTLPSLLGGSERGKDRIVPWEYDFLLPKKVLIPYCVEGEILLFRLVMETEIAPGAFGIHEPMPHWRQVLQRKASPEEIDLAILPGLAFDLEGARLGRGKGYYDQFVPNLRSDAIAVGLSFECQLFDQIPMEPHDRYLDMIITEQQVYRRPGSRQPRAGESIH